jgi:hypothetical protein
LAEPPSASNRADVTDRRRTRIEIADHALIVGLQEILPAGRHRLAAERILVDEQPERAGMDRGPVAVRILQSSRHLIPFRGLIGLQRILRLGLHAEINSEIADIADGIVLLGEDLRQSLTGVLVIVGDIVVQVGLDRFEHGRPVRPFGGAVVADDVGRFGGLPRRQKGQRKQDQGKTDGLHETISDFRHQDGRWVPTIGHA